MRIRLKESLAKAGAFARKLLIKLGFMKEKKPDYDVAGLVLELVLYLNAGMVLSAAVGEISKKERGSEVFRKVAEIKRRADASNLSFAAELYSFARTSGNREFMRIAMLILDHAGRGSELAEKLETERQRLWDSRLSRARTKAGEADTKLSLPLMLLLVSLVVICIAPAFTGF